MSPFDSVLLIPKIDDQENASVRFVTAQITKAIEEAGRFVRVYRDPKHIKPTTLVIGIGGDGTMLQAARFAHRANAWAIGVNLGKVGFLTDIANDPELPQKILAAVNEPSKLLQEERIALTTTVAEYVDQSTVFNEYVISNQYSDIPIRYHLNIGNVDAGLHRANSLIVGTPTGSTAYTLSAGGGLILPSMEAIQIIPVAPLSLTSRPIIIPSSEVITITVETQGIWTLKGDGNIIAVSREQHPIKICQAPEKLKILHPEGWTFFDMLTQKLGWRNGHTITPV